MSEPYVAQIALFGFNFAPISYAFCNGALVAISQNEALFTLIGTTYGGNGTTNFALPDLRDHSALSTGQGPGLSNYVLGQNVGTPQVSLVSSQIPQHNHIINASDAVAASDYTLAPQPNGWYGARAAGANLFDTVSNTTMAMNSITLTGGSLPHSNEQPYLGLNYCIALYGIYPTQN